MARGADLMPIFKDTQRGCTKLPAYYISNNIKKGPVSRSGATGLHHGWYTVNEGLGTLQSQTMCVTFTLDSAQSPRGRPGAGEIPQWAWWRATIVRVF